MQNESIRKKGTFKVDQIWLEITVYILEINVRTFAYCSFYQK